MNENSYQKMTLANWNFQKEMQRKHDRKPAGVLCLCGHEMVYEDRPTDFAGINNNCQNNLTPGHYPNVVCPACGHFGRKL